MMDPVLLKLALTGMALLGGMGLIFGIGLAVAAQKFAVKSDPKVEAVLECLAGAQCGACGYAGCEGYAEAVVHDPAVLPNRCFPGRAEVAEMVARITAKEVKAVADIDAVVRCSRIEGKVREKYRYLGYRTCAAAALASGGPSACQFACVGFGDCAGACPFGAIAMKDDFPVIAPEICVGCGICVKICPKHLIELIPLQARVQILCSTRGPGKEVKKICQAGCISCKKCVKVCPAHAVEFDGIIKIDHDLCIQYGATCQEICVQECPRGILRKKK